jgi:hypothetical protein
MNKIKLILGLALATLVMGQAHAVDIAGEIAINPGVGGTVVIDTALNTVSFVGPQIVSFATGDYAGVLGDTAFYADFTYSPLAVVNPLWSIDPDTYFDITSMNIVSEVAGVSVSLTGMGTAYHDAFDPTVGSWSFSADQSGSFFTWSSTTTTVPDSGATAALLGLGLLGLAGAARRFKK